jgi:hypothetical protein
LRGIIGNKPIAMDEGALRSVTHYSVTNPVDITGLLNAQGYYGAIAGAFAVSDSLAAYVWYRADPYYWDTHSYSWTWYENWNVGLFTDTIHGGLNSAGIALANTASMLAGQSVVSYTDALSMTTFTFASGNELVYANDGLTKTQTLPDGLKAVDVWGNQIATSGTITLSMPSKTLALWLIH